MNVLKVNEKLFKEVPFSFEDTQSEYEPKYFKLLGLLYENIGNR